MNEKANYGNWVPEKALYMLFGAVIVLGVIAVAVQVALSEMVIAIIVGVLCILTLVMAIYMLICHEAFAFGKGNMMAGVHEHLIKHLDWDGEGKLLDIGCGAAGIVPAILWLTGTVRITWLSVICVGLSVLYLIGLFFFRGKDFMREMQKKFRV